MSSLLTRVRRAYGANPLHLLALVACFALTGYVATHLVHDPLIVRILIWFGGAVIGHDLVLFPLYALANWSLAGLLKLLPATRLNRAPVVSPLNYLRTPALGTALLLVLFLPGIIQQGAGTFHNATGLTQAPYLGRWLVLTGVMFAVSAVVYAVRSRQASAPQRAVARQLRSLLAPGEHVLTVAYRDHVAAALCTTRALHHRGEDETAGWLRVGWADVAEVHWHADTDLLAVTGLSGAPVEHVTIPLTEVGNLVEVAQDLIATASVVTLSTYMAGDRHATITVRREPDTGRLVWRVGLDDGLDPDNPDVRKWVDAAITSIVDDLGLARPPATDLTGLHEHGASA
jgi:hypothetical protein